MAVGRASDGGQLDMTSRSSRIAAPRAGRSVEGMVAPLREHVARSVDAVDPAALGDVLWLTKASRHDHVASDVKSRAKWAVTAIALLDMINSGNGPNVARALAWFGVASTTVLWSEAESALRPLQGHADLLELLPYLLDTYGRTSRLDVMRDASLHAKRAARKESGSFYTPADVADFMVSSIASAPADPSFVSEWWMDPACGSGVFLVAALRRRLAQDAANASSFAATRLTGCDISPQACDFAAFAILAQLPSTESKPLDLWSSIRRNLMALDATKPANEPGGRGLREAVPHGEGPLRLICNPPYASSSPSSVTLIDGLPTSSLYLPFVEMAWRVAHEPEDAAALVVPLSLAANRSADHRRCRTAMARAGGNWTLLFFDRQPHALFGEDAKTRATIAIRRPGPTPAEIKTSGLLKWTSRQRSSIFDETRAVSIGPANIGRIVPKLGSILEVELYRALDPFRLRAGLRPDPTKAAAEEIVGTALSSDVFVAGTAYNFLNVFRNYPDHLSWRGALSASGIHRLRCASIKEADIVTSILASRTAFWLWHVECDGFHVPSWFLADLPLLNMRLLDDVTDELAALGQRIWGGLQEDVLCSVNRERLTFAFRPTTISPLREAVDRLLLKALGVDPARATTLIEFERKVVSIDGSVRLSKASQEMGNSR